MKKLKIFALTLLLISLPITALAYSNADDNIYIAEDEVVDGNFIKVAGTATIDGAVNGDVILMAGNVTINGPVAGDVFALAGNVTINGDVAGSVRVAGGDVVVAGKVERNVNAAAGTVVIMESAQIGWDIIVVAGSVVIEGKVLGNINISGGSVVLSNEVGKDAVLNLGKSGVATLRSNAKINGNLNYIANNADQLAKSESAQILGETNHNLVAAARVKAPSSGIFYFFGKLASLFGLIIVGLVLITLVPKVVSQISIELTKSPLRNLGWGLIYAVITPIVIFLLLITIIGIPLAFILIPFYFIVLYLSKIIAGITIGLLIVNWLTKGKYKKTLIWPMVLGLVAMDIIVSIPVLGWLVGILLVLWALGGLIEVKKAIIADLR